ncbi:MAG: type I methionyl aminopeptidase [Myxococcales bacterium]|nr:type I methionyl aminopeptidase [Myxococcales bacterium]
MGIVLKSDAELEKMWAANQVVCDVLDALEETIAPGVTTGDLGRIAAELCDKAGATSAFLNYAPPQHPPFPSVLCASVNDVVVHGIPSDETRLESGDIISIDFGCSVDGYFGDSARTVAVGEISARARQLLDVTQEALERAIEQCVAGNRMSDLSGAIERYVEQQGFGIVRVFGGHGIGRKMHEDPPVPNYVAGGRNPRFKRGMVLAIEPMVNVGSADVKVDADQWTVRTKDGQLSAHFEHSVAILGDTPWVLSRRDSRRAVATA